MKKLVGLTIGVGLAAAMAVPVGALKMATARFDDMYVCYYADYNQDGQLELVTLGGEPGGYSAMGNRLESKIYALVDGKARIFTAENGSVKFASIPCGFRNKQTGELKWYVFDSPTCVTRYIYEVIFNYDTYAYHTIELNADEKNSNDYYQWLTTWESVWEQDHSSLNAITQGENKFFEGTLTEERIMQLLLDANPEQLEQLAIPALHKGLAIPLPTVVLAVTAVAAAITIACLIYISKRRT